MSQRIMIDSMNRKPLRQRCYGGIPHLPGSKMIDERDTGIQPKQATMFTEKVRRPKTDSVIVQEKLDGCCMAVAKVNGELLPLSRAGYLAKDCNFAFMRAFADFVDSELSPYLDMILEDGERLVGEWLILAHGIKYKFDHMPFVAFDIMRGHDRVSTDEFYDRLDLYSPYIPTPRLVHRGCIAPDEALRMLLAMPLRYEQSEPPEGIVYRCNRGDECIALAKYVRGDFTAGKYLDSVTGAGEVFNEWKGWQCSVSA